MYGGNPNRAFVGDPFDEKSFGVFHEPIFQLLKQKAPSQFTCIDLTGCTFEHLLQQTKEKKCPAIVWFFLWLLSCVIHERCTLEMRKPEVTDIWIDVKALKELKEETLIKWQSPEHCALLVRPFKLATLF